MTPSTPSPLARGRLRSLLGGAWLLAHALFTSAATALPPDIEAALTRSRLPRDSVALLVSEVQGQRPPRLALNPGTPMNPASVTKLITTEAALELLGPAFSWQTPVYLDGTVREGTLQGNLVIKGQGDPKLVLERLWLLLRRVQGLGIRQISGDIVLDHSAFEHQLGVALALDDQVALQRALAHRAIEVHRGLPTEGRPQQLQGRLGGDQLGHRGRVHRRARVQRQPGRARPLPWPLNIAHQQGHRITGQA